MVTKGTYIELDAVTLDNGVFMERLTAEIRKAAVDLAKFQKESETKGGKATVSVQLTIKRSGKEHAAIDYVVTHKVPKVGTGTMVRMADTGRLLLDEATRGAGLNDRDQLQLFDRSGNMTHKVDPATGEIVDDPEVAGKVGGSDTPA